MQPLEYQWEHAVNSRAHLEQVQAHVLAAAKDNRLLTDETLVNAIEADIIWSESQQIPVMGHPPQTDGDLPFADFLHEMQDLAMLIAASYESNYQTEWAPWIVKLDFKSMQAFRASVELLRPFIVNFPFASGSIFLNADILIGPATNASHLRFHATEFMDMAVALSALDGHDFQHKLVYSVGWTTSGKTAEELEACYTIEMVQEMVQLLAQYESDHKQLRVTFPLRATCFQASWPVLCRLLEASPRYGFTLWWNQSKLPDDILAWIVGTLEHPPFAQRTFYDILGFHAFRQTQMHHT